LYRSSGPPRGHKQSRLQDNWTTCFGAVAAGCLAISVNAFGADLGTGHTGAIAVHRAPRRPVAGRYRLTRLTLPGAKPDRSVERSRVVDQVYEELMRVDSARLLVGGDQGLMSAVLNPVVRSLSPGRQNRISALRSQRIFPN